MNITKAFVDYIATLGFGTFGTNLFISGVPASAPDATWWVLSAGGSPIVKAVTGSKLKNYIFHVFYRSNDDEDVFNKLQAFEEAMNSANCDEITGYDKIELEASAFPVDQDLDAEDRTVGLVEVTLTTYKN